jgi:hypothetical protein
MRIATVLMAMLFPLLSTAQNLPANFNLVPNPGFELTQGTLFKAITGYGNYYLITDTSFGSNPSCWVRPTRIYSRIIEPQNSIYGSSTAIPHSGTKTLQLAQAVNFVYRISTGQVVDSSGITSPRYTYAQTKLYRALSAGVTYNFTMYVGCLWLSTQSSGTFGPVPRHQPYVLGNIGVLFSSNAVRDYGFYTFRLYATPQIRYTQWPLPPPDTFGYTKLTGTYTA